MTKTKSPKTIISVIGVAPLILVAITAALICITGSEILAYNRLKTKANDSRVVDCAYINDSEVASRCESELEHDDLMMEIQLQNGYSNIVVLIAITALSAGLDVAYLSLARK